MFENVDHDVRRLERERAELAAGEIVVQRKAQAREPAVRIGAVTEGERGIAQPLGVQRVHRDQPVGDDVRVIVEDEGTVQSRRVDAKNPHAEHGEEEEGGQMADLGAHTPIIR
jgi:hypothetical protein